MDPIERNARRLINVMARRLPSGGTSEDLRHQFQADTSLKAPQSFYSALRFAKEALWIVGGEIDPHRPRVVTGSIYKLNPDGSWPAVSVEEQPAETPLDSLPDWSSGSNGVALRNLLEIVSSSAASMRQKLKAAAAILNFQVEDLGVIEFTRKFLETVCAGIDVAVDYKVEAATLLRANESPRVKAETVAPSYADNAEPAGPPPQPLSELLIERRAYHDRMAVELEAEMRREREREAQSKQRGDGGDS